MKSYMRQLHRCDTFEPRHRHELSAKEKAEVIESHMFLKLRIYGNIKVQAVTGVNKQRYFISKEEASSTTVGTKAVLIYCVTDAQEHQYVTTIDIPNAFIQNRVKKIEDMATIILRGELVDVLVEIAPDIYGPYVSTDKKEIKTLILGSHNTIFKTLVASLLY